MIYKIFELVDGHAFSQSVTPNCHKMYKTDESCLFRRKTYLECRFQHNHVSRTLYPRLAVHLDRYVRMQMNFYVSTLKPRRFDEHSHLTGRFIEITCAILRAERKPDWIWPRWTTPVTPTTSNIPSQWLGFENWSSFSGPQGLAPEPQLNTKPSEHSHPIKLSINLPQNVQNYDSFHLWQLHQFPVNL